MMVAVLAAAQGSPTCCSWAWGSAAPSEQWQGCVRPEKSLLELLRVLEMGDVDFVGAGGE